MSYLSHNVYPDWLQDNHDELMEQFIEEFHQDAFDEYTWDQFELSMQE